MTFAAGTTTQTIAVTVCRDIVFEANETFTVDLSAPTNATISDASGLGTINNDDTAPSLTINNVSAAEGDAGTTAFTFTVTQSAASGVATTVNYATSPGTATAGVTCPGAFDYETETGTVTIPAGSTTGTIIVNVCGDLLFEPNETFTVTLSGPVNATISDGSGTGTITNDDASNSAPTDIALSNNTVAENAGANATVGTLSTTDPNVGDTFTYTLVAGTGSTGNGSFNISGNTLRATASLNFEAQSSYSVRIRTTDQAGLFFEEAFTITVTNVNEAPVVTLSAGNDLSVDEGTSHTYSFTVSDVAAVTTFTVVSADCGANGSQVGTTATTATGGSFVCLFPDGPASSVVSVRSRTPTTRTATPPPRR